MLDPQDSSDQNSVDMSAKSNLNEPQAAIVAALVNGNCWLQQDPETKAYQLYHNGTKLGYALSEAEVMQLIAQGLVGKVEQIKLTPEGRMWATQSQLP
jgi:hypothetical protein